MYVLYILTPPAATRAEKHRRLSIQFMYNTYDTELSTPQGENQEKECLGIFRAVVCLLD